MSDFLDVITWRQGKAKPYAHKVGFAMRKDNGDISVTFNSLPLPDEKGQVRVVIQEPRERSDAPRSQSYGGGRPSAPPSAALDDEVPF